MEFHYLRLDQSDVEFPGLVFDINWLVTNAYELTYTLKDQPYCDLLTVNGWYNRTNFEGDTSRPGKHRQIPSLRDELGLPVGVNAFTDVDGASGGYRAAMTWGQIDEAQWTLGTDLIYVTQQLNDIVPAHTWQPPWWFSPISWPERNYPIPRSHSNDVGLFVDHRRPVSECLTLNLGARVDMVTTDARERVRSMGDLVGLPNPYVIERDLSEMKNAPLEQSFTPWAMFATLERKLNYCWTMTAGAGHAVRPPTLTELYAERSFIGSLQPGLTFVHGDPALEPERLTQIDLGLHADYGCFRMSLCGFYAWVEDYITFDNIDWPNYVPGETLQEVAFTNTDLATLAGFELMVEEDFNCWLTGFALMSFVEGRDHTRSEPSRIRTEVTWWVDPDVRSGVEGVEEEPLPGIPPLDSRVGVRLHEPTRLPSWAVEFEARIVATQHRVASTLFEQTTPSFAVGNIRSYWQARDNVLFIAGVENFTDTFYREHLDYRSGRGVFRPGINFYFSGELTY